MQVILTASMAGTERTYEAQMLVNCDDAEGKRLIEAGFARELTADEPTKPQLDKQANLGDYVPSSAPAAVKKPAKKTE